MADTLSATAVLWLIIGLSSTVVAAKCPFNFGRGHDADDIQPNLYAEPRRMLLGFNANAVNGLDINAVKADLKALFVDSKPHWPADSGHYGPLMIRMAWHCAGSYRLSDGRGGCDGGRQRFDPERSWPDNTNLDKARGLLWPIKEKYGEALSWGDLIILAGDAAIESMGGPILGFCAGRIDDIDGAASLPLGPSLDQEMVAPCSVNGECEAPLGASTMGLIYVNPEGPLGVPDPAASAPNIREVFGRMAMNDSETVALIGGGHAFGKTHGACPSGPGPDPAHQPWDPWPGTCGTGPLQGKGNNTFTSGFGGPWTTNPTKWDNEYFKNLLEYGWEVYMGPGGHHQWRPTKLNDSDPEHELPDIIMLTTDVALLHDPSYLELVKLYASDLEALNKAFSHAWYKLVTRDMGPITRCLGNQLPPAQPFQAPLPPPPSPKPDFNAVTRAVIRALRTASSALAGDLVGAKPYYGALFATLAWQCASSFRQTDYTGGCNGARIRLAPQKDWPQNKGMDKVLAVLEPIKAQYPTLTYADLIVVAGTTALTNAGAKKLKFCGGRSDADPNEPTVHIQPPRVFNDKLTQVKDNAVVMGLTYREAVAIAARPRSPSYQKDQGYSGSWASDPSKLTNEYFKVLLNNEWVNTTSSSGQLEMKAVGKDIYMTPTDVAIKWCPVLSAIAQEYATDAAAFFDAFASGWNKLMNADRFKGPAANVCS